MYRGPVRFFKVVSKHDMELAVWQVDATPTGKWTEIGVCGTENRCWDYIDQKEGQTGFLFNLFTPAGQSYGEF